MKSQIRLVAALFCASVFVGSGRGAELTDGTLLFLENCSSVVERATKGEIAHVALVFADGSESWVYEATPAKVRRVTANEYFAELSRLNHRRDADEQIGVIALSPRVAYQPGEIAKMRDFLDGQIGRRYSVKNYVRGKPYDGIHCAELASNTLNASGRYAFEDCHKIDPQALYTAVLPTHQTAERLMMPTIEAKEPWRIRIGRQLSGWTNWCGWSCQEAWLFLW
jgi:hypothetical protein